MEEVNVRLLNSLRTKIKVWSLIVLVLGILAFSNFWLMVSGVYGEHFYYVSRFDIVKVSVLLTLGIVIAISTFALLQRNRRTSAKYLLVIVFFVHVIATFFTSISVYSGVYVFAWGYFNPFWMLDVIIWTALFICYWALLIYVVMYYAETRSLKETMPQYYPQHYAQPQPYYAPPQVEVENLRMNQSN
jgi:hypothetical protein